MARTDRRRTLRTGVETQLRSPGLQTNRRFLQPGRFNDGVRTARALEQALGVGSNLVADEANRNNIEGRNRALAERGAGQQTRNEDDDQAGYIRAWDELDAEFDANLMAKELPELLRGFNWEERTETEVQNFISQQMEDQFKGVELDGDSAYARVLGPALMDMETQLLTQHRDMQLEKVREEQRTKIYSNAKEELAETGEINYEKLFTQTGKFFNGREKKGVYWEAIYEMAIDAGDPDLITDMPEQINGVRTGISDPALQAEHRAAINAAARKAAHIASQATARQKAADEQEVFDLQVLIMEKTMRGEDTTQELLRLQNNPEATFSNYSSARTFGQGQLDEADSRSANEQFVAGLWQDIYSGKAGLDDIARARSEGELGTGPQANDTLKEMMDEVAQVRQGNLRGDSATVSVYRSEITKRFNPAINGPAAALDTSLLNLQNLGVSMYNELVFQQGVDPFEAKNRVFEKYEPEIDRLTVNAQSTTAFIRANQLAPVVDFKASLGGDEDATRRILDLPQSGVEALLFDYQQSGDLTEEEALRFFETHY